MGDLRQKILDASVALVEEQGVRAVSFREVARRAGVSHQAPYHHFGNYHGILRAIAREGFAGLSQAMNDAAERADDPLEALTDAGVAYANFARTHAGHFRVMFQRALVNIRDREDPLEEAEAAHATLIRLAAAASEAGFGSQLTVDGLTHICWATVHGISTLLVEGVLAEKTPMSESIEAELVQQVVRGLSALLRKDSEGKA
ncbi:MAG: TetR/AcrR family transcriptional regulator [Myxococcota bacterium]